MFIYQTKINGKDGLVALAETQDGGKQLPLYGEEVYTVSESDGVLEQKDLVLTESGDTQKYTIVFADPEGEPLEVKEVPYGDTPSYTGETPTKTATAQYTYTFAGWDPEVVAVTGDAVYTAQFDSTVNKYTVTWKNSDGTVLKTDTEVPYGETPVYTGEAIANLKGWDPEVAPVTADAIYTAVVEAPSEQNP